MSTVYALSKSADGGGNDDVGSCASDRSYARFMGGRYFPLTDFLFSKWYMGLVPVAIALVVLPFEAVHALLKLSIPSICCWRRKPSSTPVVQLPAVPVASLVYS